MVSDQHPAGRSGAVRLPLSAAQRDIWLAHDADATGRRYSIGEYREVLGVLDTGLLADCWYRLVRESDALRISGTESDEAGIRQILDPDPGDRRLEQVDVADAADPEAAARQWMHADLARPVDLARGPLTRHALIRLAGDRYFYYHRYHHLVMDGMGASLVISRLSELYEQAASGVPWGPGPFGTLSELLAEEEAYRASAQAAEDRAHWARHLTGLPGTPRLGEGRTPDHDPQVPFVRRTVLVDAATADRIRSGARPEYKVSWPVLLVALVAAYAHRAGGAADELVVGLPVTGRTTPAARSTPGMLSNVVPLRINARDARTPAGLVAATAAEVRRALRHQRTRYEDMCRDLGLGESDRRVSAPLVNIMAFGGDTSFAGLPSVQHNLSNGPVEDLAVAVYDLGPGRGLRVDFDAAPGVTDLDAVAAHQDRLVRFLRTALDAPHTPLAELPLLTAEERRLVVEEWNATAVELEDASLAELVERQAVIRPDQPAVIFGDQVLDYAELNARANRLAHHLRASGARRGTITGVLLDRGTDFAVAVLAVTKTGAAYTLLDPDFPDDRLAGSARDADLAVLVTDTAHAHRVTGPWHTVDLTADRAAVAARPAGNLHEAVTGADSACVMFTSGSTGRPKGILSTHRALVSTVTAQTYCPFGPGQVFLQCSPVSWDAFSLEFWGALLHGGTTVLQPGQKPEPAHITTLTQQHRVTMLQLSSSLFNHLADDHPDTFTTPTTVFTGGEPASPTHIHAIHQLHPHLTITNGYGPAESMGFTTTHTLHPTPQPQTTVPIGHPLTNKTAYLLDPHLQPTPPGTTGELYLAGHGLAHGYHHQPTTTAQRFIPNPYGPPGTRLYRTGDLCRQLPDGRLVYAGRADAQIKIRGFRIEPAEVETALAAHPEVGQASVGAFPDRRGTPQLTAHVTAAGSARPDPRALREWLRERLPEHMVPAHVVLLDRMPLTANGKADRKALPAPTTTTGDRTPARPPRTPLEALVCTHFTDTLTADHPLTPDDDFFDHGGHSLLAARLAARLTTAIGTLSTPLTIRDVFQHPTPAALTDHLVAMGAGPEPGGGQDGGRPAKRARPALRRRTEAGALLTP